MAHMENCWKAMAFMRICSGNKGRYISVNNKKIAMPAKLVFGWFGYLMPCQKGASQEGLSA